MEFLQAMLSDSARNAKVGQAKPKAKGNVVIVGGNGLPYIATAKSRVSEVGVVTTKRASGQPSKIAADNTTTRKHRIPDKATKEPAISSTTKTKSKSRSKVKPTEDAVPNKDTTDIPTTAQAPTAAHSAPTQPTIAAETTATKASQISKTQNAAQQDTAGVDKMVENQLVRHCAGNSYTSVARLISKSPELAETAIGTGLFKGFKPVHLCAWHDAQDALQALLDNGANPNVNSRRGQSALHICALRGSAKCATTLLSTGAVDVNAKNVKRFNQTPLHLACLKGNAAVAQLLLDAGASFTLTSNKTGPLSPLSLAIMNHHSAVISCLLNNCRSAIILNQSENGWSPLQFAIAFKNTEALTQLLPLIASMSNPELELKCCLSVSVAMRDISALRKVLAACKSPASTTLFTLSLPARWPKIKASEAQKDKLVPTKVGTLYLQRWKLFRGNLIHLAVRIGDAEILRELLTFSAAANILNPTCLEFDLHHKTPLVCACGAGNEELVEILVDRCKNAINHHWESSNAYHTRKGPTPLQQACSGGHAGVVRILLRHGADPTKVGTLNRTPVFFAAVAPSAACVRLLLESLDKKTASDKVLNLRSFRTEMSVLHAAVLNGDQEVVETLLEFGADPNATRAHGQTPLHMACKAANIAVVRALIAHGADVRAQMVSAGKKISPLAIARALKDGDEIVSALLPGYRGADASGGDVSGALDIGKKTHDKSKPGLLQFEPNDSDLTTEDHTLLSAQLHPQIRGVYTDYAAVFSAQKANESTQVHTQTENTNVEWRTLRVFVSSTFVDMQAERECIIKIVMPRLQNLCDKHRINLIPIDLRWGVTDEDAKSGKVTDMCLSHAERSEIFLCTLGNRYGWVPPQEVVPEHVVERFAWVQGSSVTDMEVNVALRSGNKATVFMLRDTQPVVAQQPQRQQPVVQQVQQIEQLQQSGKGRGKGRGRGRKSKADLEVSVVRAAIPSVPVAVAPSGGSEFVETDEERVEKMNALRRRVEESGYPCFHYSPKWSQTSIAPDSLSTYSDQIVRSLWEQINDLFSLQDTVVLSPHERENKSHLNFVSRRTRTFVGRPSMVSNLTNLSTPNAVSGSSHRAAQADENGPSRCPVVVLGQPGSGKSSLVACAVANLLERTKLEDELFVFAHFVGASPLSVSFSSFLVRLITELEAFYTKIGLAYTPLHTTLPSPSHSMAALPLDCLTDHIRTLLTLPTSPDAVYEFGVRPSRIAIVCDAVNQMDNEEVAWLRWLPLPLPENVVAMVSCVKEGTHADALRAAVTRLGQSLESCGENGGVFNVGALSAQDAQDIVESTMATFHKTLTQDQLAKLLAKSGTSSPLYTTLLCEELRLHGSFETLTARIASASATVPGLLAEVLQRLENEHSRSVVEAALGFLQCARTGLLETELLGLCGSIDSSAWAKLFWSLQFFLRPIGDDHTGRLDFFHRQLAKAIQLRYFPTPLSQERVHKRMAQFFFEQYRLGKGDGARALGEVVHHFLEANDQAGVTSILSNMTLVAERCKFGQTYDMVREFGLAAAKKYDLQNMAEFVSTNAHILHSHPRVVLQQAFNMTQIYGNSFVPKDSIFMRWMNRDNTPPVGRVKEQLSLVFTSEVNALSFDPSGRFLVTGHKSGSVCVWEIKSGELKVNTSDGSGMRVTQVVCIKGTTNVAVSCGTGVQIYAIDTGAPVSRIVTHPGAEALGCDVTCDFKSMIVSGSDGKLVLFDLATRQVKASVQPSTQSLMFACCSPETSLVACGGASKSCYFYRIQDDELVPVGVVSKHTKTIRCGSFSCDGLRIATGSQDKTIVCVDVRSIVGDGVSDDLPVTFTSDEHTDNVCGLSFLPDGRLVSCSWDRTCRVFDVSGSSVGLIAGHGHFINKVASSRDGNLIASGSVDMSTRLYRTSDVASTKTKAARPRCNLHTKLVRGLAISPDGTKLASGSWDKSVKVHALTDGSGLGTQALLDVESHTKRVNWVTFSHCGRFVLSASMDGCCDLHELQSGDCLMRYRGHTGNVLVCEFSHDDQYMVSGGTDHKAILWFSASGEKITELQHDSWVSVVQFLSKGRIVVCATMNGGLHVWNTTTGDEVMVIKPHDGPIFALVATPDNKTIFTGGRDMTIRMIDTTTWEEKRVFQGYHTHEVTGLSLFGPKKQHLVSVASDKSLRIWDLARADDAGPVWEYFCIANAIAVTSTRNKVVVGDSLGNVCVLEVTGLF